MSETERRGEVRRELVSDIVGVVCYAACSSSTVHSHFWFTAAGCEQSCSNVEKYVG